jgi:cysteine-rich repeat protein
MMAAVMLARRSRLPLGSTVACAGLLACGPDVALDDASSSSGSTDACAIGAQGCECTAGGGCDPGLVCEVAVCVAESTVGSSDAGGDTLEPSTGGRTSDETDSSSITATTGSFSTGTGESGESSGVMRGCGDDELEPPEECDDGNNLSRDGCNADCTLGGQLVWQAALQGPFALEDWGHRIAIDSQDDVLVAAVTFAPGNSDRDGWLIKLDDDGQFEWDDVFDSDAGPSSDGWWGVAAGPSDEVVVAGWTDTPDAGTDAMVRCYSADGEVLWTHVQEVVSDGQAYDVAVDAAGDIVVLGSQRDPLDASFQTWLAKLTMDGNIVWSEVFENGMYPTPLALTVDASGAISYGAGDSYAFVRKLSPDAEEEWLWTGDLGGWFIGGLAADAMGNVVAGGGIGSNPSHSRVARHSSDSGSADWEVEWMGSFGAYALTQAVALDTDGRPVTAGHQAGASGNGVYVRKLDAQGDPAWLFEQDSADGGSDLLIGVALDSTGHVYASGRQRQASGTDDVLVLKLTP